MGRALGIFQHGVSRRRTGRQPKQREEGSWKYPPLEAEIEDADFEEKGYYILRRQNMFAQNIVTRPIPVLCKKTVWRLGYWVAWRWWEQEGIELAGVRAR